MQAAAERLRPGAERLRAQAAALSRHPALVRLGPCVAVLVGVILTAVGILLLLVGGALVAGREGLLVYAALFHLPPSAGCCALALWRSRPARTRRARRAVTVGFGMSATLLTVATDKALDAAATQVTCRRLAAQSPSPRVRL